MVDRPNYEPAEVALAALLSRNNNADSPHRPRRLARSVRVTLIGLLAVLAIANPGCRCTPETPQERAEREAREAEEERKRREEELARAPLRLPAATVLPAGEDDPTLTAKSGHWNEVAQPLVANTMDFDGSLSHVVTTKEGQPITAPRTPFAVRTERPLVVAKKSTKTSRAPVYFPPASGPQRVRTMVRDRASGAIRDDTPSPTRPLLDHQYQIVVLAKEPSRYAFLDGLTCVSGALPDTIDVSTLQQGASTLTPARNYRVVAMNAEPGAATPPRLPETPLAWTSIAYVFWDEIDPQALTPAQREAMLDWLHWGGQLIVNGPDSIDLLRGSFLEQLLPASGGDARQLTAEELQRFGQTWAASRGTPLGTESGWSAISLKLTKNARWIRGAGGLFCERRVGRGRIALSAVQLAEPALLTWSDGVESFYNNAMFRRPPRRFRREGASGGNARAVAVWAASNTIEIDPLRNSALRLFVRDTYADPTKLRAGIASDGVDDGATTGGQRSARVVSEFRRLTAPPIRGGAAAWSDSSLAAGAARDALRRSSGVSVPDAGFVLGCLGAYLLVLVPLNWGFFYAVGKTELAWVAAPLIAIGAAVVVVQQAQLDIGFVRAQTEIAVLETQPGAPRGLLTRFNALYTSLSTSYDLEFDTATAVATPFARLTESEAAQAQASQGSLLGDVVPTVNFERLEKARLRGLGVSSASTEFVRSEEMLDLAEYSFTSVDGGVVIGQSLSGVDRLENRTQWDLTDTALVRRRDGVDGPAELEGCWIGELQAGATATISFTPVFGVSGGSAFAAERDNAEIAEADDEAELDLEPLFTLALDPERFEPGELRCVARIEGTREGLTITPRASQRRGATLLVAHLGYGPLPPTQSDANSPASVAGRKRPNR